MQQEFVKKAEQVMEAFDFSEVQAYALLTSQSVTSVQTITKLKETALYVIETAINGFITLDTHRGINHCSASTAGFTAAVTRYSKKGDIYVSLNFSIVSVCR